MTKTDFFRKWYFESVAAQTSKTIHQYT